AARFQAEQAQQMAGWLADELNAIPVFPGEIARRVNRAARPGGVASVIIHLPDLVGDGVETLAVRDGSQHAGGPAVDRFVVAIGNRHVHARVAVRGRAEDEVVLGQSETPGVVVARTNEFQLRAVRLEPKDALSKPNLLAADRA